MKYLWTSWTPGASKHQVLLDNKAPAKTIRLNGYGMGVTFTTQAFVWRQSFSGHAALLKFNAPSY